MPVVDMRVMDMVKPAGEVRHTGVHPAALTTVGRSGHIAMAVTALAAEWTPVPAGHIPEPEPEG